MSCCGNTDSQPILKNGLAFPSLYSLQELRQPICMQCERYKTNEYGESFCGFVLKEYDLEECLVGYLLKKARVQLDLLWQNPFASCPLNRWYRITEDKILKAIQNGKAMAK